MLTESDMFVLAKLLVAPADDVSTSWLATELGMPQAQTFRAIQRAEHSRLLTQMSPARGRKGSIKRLNRQGLFELFAYGLPYMFPGHIGRLEKGVPTAASAPVMRGQFASNEEPLVWASPHGTIRGMSVTPLHHRAPDAALADAKLYEILALLDAVRCGRARERELARSQLKERLL